MAGRAGVLGGILVLCITLLGSGDAFTQSDNDLFLPELEVITAANAGRLEQIGMIGYGLIADSDYAVDGETVAIAGSLGLVFYDADDFEREPFDRWMLPEAIVHAVAYHPDGRIIATASSDREPSIDTDFVFRLWEIETQTILAEWQHNQGRSSSLTFSPDGHELVLIDRYDNDLTARWDVSNFSDITTLPTLPIWEVERQWAGVDALADIEDTMEFGHVLTYSADGRYAAYTDFYTVQLIDLVTGDVRFNWQPDEGYNLYGSNNLMFTPNSRLVVSLAYSTPNAGIIEAWDVKTGDKVFSRRRDGISNLSFHPTQSEIILGTWYGGGMMQWQAGMDDAVYVLGPDVLWTRDSYGQLTFNTDGDVLVVNHKGAVEFWDVRRGIKVRDDLVLPRDDVDRNTYGQLTFTPDGRYFLAMTRDELQIYDGTTFAYLGSTTTPNGWGNHLAFNAESTLMAAYTAGFDTSTLTLWDLEEVVDGGVVTPTATMEHFTLSQQFNADVAFTPDGSGIVLPGVGVELWDTETILEAGQLDYPGTQSVDTSPAFVRNFGGHTTAAPFAFSPSGRLIATGSNGVDCYAAVWEVNTGEQAACLGEPSPDGHTPRQYVFLDEHVLLTGAEINYLSGDTGSLSLSTTVRVWDVQAGTLLTELEGHFESYNDIIVSPNGRMIITGGGSFPLDCSECPTYDGSLRFWGVPTGE